MNVYGAEMEASIVLVLGRLWGLRAGGMAVCLDNLLHVSDGADSFDPQSQLSHSQDNIQKLSIAGCEALLRLWKADSAK